MGSEMCIRDRPLADQSGVGVTGKDARGRGEKMTGNDCRGRIDACLLYTSDAADERSSVDLGGRRIIKKKK